MSDNKIELSGIFSDGYGFVPKKLMKAQDINSNTKLVICYLLSFTGAGNSCFPSIESMATDLGISTRTVMRCLSSASKNGYVSKHKNGLGYGKGIHNIYNLEFMDGFSKIQSDKKSQRKNVTVTKSQSDNEAIQCDKNDIYEVTPGKCNNNSNNNNNNNNNSELTELRNKIRTYFESNNPEYWHDGKQIGGIEKIIKKSRADEKKIFTTFAKHKKIIKIDKSEYWKHDPHTPSVISQKWDGILSYKLPIESPIL